jgi:putative proteasome-type protease
MPLDMAIAKTGQIGEVLTRRFEADDASFRAVSEHWSRALREAFHSLPEIAVTQDPLGNGS